MKTTIIITRSEEFVRAARLATGTNVPEEIEDEVEIAELSPATRELLLDANGGSYRPSYDHIRFDLGYTPSAGSWHGKIPVRVDSDTPTVDEIDAAIREAFAELARRREEHLAEKAAKEQAEKALASEWAALPLTVRASTHGPCYCRANDGSLSSSGTVAYPRDALTAYAAQAWEETVAYSKTLQAIELGNQAIADRKTLAEFLAEFPDDALRGIIKKIVRSDDADRIAELKQKIENASPDITIFGDDFDGDDE